MAAAQSIWKMALRNLSSQNTTTILTVAAIAVCVMTFVSVFSILDGLQLTIEDVMKKYYGQRNIFVLTSQASPNFHESEVPRQVADDYRELPAVHALSEEAYAEAAYEGIEIDIVGVDLPDLQSVHTFQKLDGRVLREPGECLAGITLAGTIGISVGTNLSIHVEGQAIQLSVVGVFQTNTTIDALILVDRDYLSSLLPRFRSNSSILRIYVLQLEEAQELADFTRTNHPELEIREGHQVSKFFEKSIINISRLLSTIVVFVILLMVLGIYNSMNMVVSERRWEIGVVRAVGARRSFVLRLFLAESATLALLGGLFGVALGIAMSHAITSFFSVFVEGSTSVAPLTKLTTIGWGMVASLSIGLIGGIFPASRASNLQISEALSEG